VYLSTKRYEGVLDVKEVGGRMSDGLVVVISQIPGFITYYCAESENNVLVTTSVFETQASSEESGRREVTWARENLGFLMPNLPQITVGEVTASGSR
jgi:hypothetical protein